MNVKLIAVCTFLGLLFVSSIVQAGSYQLTVRHQPSGNYEALISYDTDVFCFVPVNPASSVQINGFDIVIQSPEYTGQILCITPSPPIQYYEETTDLGALPPGNYNISWDQPQAFSLSTSVSLPLPNRIPSNSTWALVLLILGIMAVALYVPRLRTHSGRK